MCGDASPPAGAEGGAREASWVKEGWAGLVLMGLARWGATTWGPHPPLPRSLPQEWLSRFGYLPPVDPTTGQLQTQEELTKAVATMQRFAGLEATGVLGQSQAGLGAWCPQLPLPCAPPPTPAGEWSQGSSWEPLCHPHLPPEVGTATPRPSFTLCLIPAQWGTSWCCPNAQLSKRNQKSGGGG